ncbi:xanthine dehydrogenase family protein molybdopterin-binding subunit [Qipengyuania flava]|uniref:xanthine dehydrogenase family protein molybdopterin-binding subunit n=1 Tax=Qipengyuania flava TaxID=192812 RepID=UPI001C62FACB|nr:molybdopterin cofactor-binding domain-containing protein [Qipengyuania flava]QYJ06945.1 molybdopterin-dependent oxidoreductase [Qipengyuania flava]
MDWRAKLDDLPVSRRQLLAGAAVGGGLAVAWWLWPKHYDSPLSPGPNERDFGGWITIGTDGVVTVAVPQLEMGQGVTTVLAQVVAVELGADWRQIAIEPVPPSGLYANVPLAAKWAPLWSNLPSFASDPDSRLAENFARDNGFAVTADGSSLTAYEQPLREAAAAARAMLAMAAADRWDADWEQCEVTGGLVRFGENQLGFGALVEEAAGYAPPDPPPLRVEPASEDISPAEAELAPQYPRLDLPAKVDGSFLFAGDVRLPGLVYASIRHGPLGKPDLSAFEAAAVEGMQGLVGVVRSKRYLAAVGESWWVAEQALKRMRPAFAGPPAVESAAALEALDAAHDEGEPSRALEVGDADALLARADYAQSYSVGPAVHASIETASATARFDGDTLELWIAAQAPEQTRKAAGKAIGLAPEKVVIYPTAAGGSFDSRLERRHAIEVAQIAKAIGRPVNLTWPRVQELQSVPVRTPVSARMEAAFVPASGGRIAAWRARLAMPATAHEFGERFFDNKTPDAAMENARGETDVLACAGAVPAYGIENVAIDHLSTPLPFPTGRMRGNANAYTAFFTESFVDELAERAGRDPFLYRMEMLGQSARMADVLRRATRLANWDGGRRGTGQGLAMLRMGSGEAGGHIACVAQASLGDGGVRVTRLHAAVDIGRVVNHDIARQQIEGGLLFGLSLATGSSIVYEDGKPVPSRLAALGLPTLADSPEIVVEFLSSDAPAFDPGELGVAVAPPAIANALYSATGVRFRRLPLLSEGL